MTYLLNVAPSSFGWINRRTTCISRLASLNRVLCFSKTMCCKSKSGNRKLTHCPESEQTTLRIVREWAWRMKKGDWRWNFAVEQRGSHTDMLDVTRAGGFASCLVFVLQRVAVERRIDRELWQTLLFR